MSLWVTWEVALVRDGDLGLTALPATAAGASLWEFLPVNCVKFRAFLNGPWLD